MSYKMTPVLQHLLADTCQQGYLETLELQILFFQQAPGTLLDISQLLADLLPFVMPFSCLASTLQHTKAKSARERKHDECEHLCFMCTM